MRRFDEKIQQIESQLNEFDFLKKGAKYLGKQAKGIATAPIQAVSTGGQLLKKGAEIAADVGKGVVDAGKSIAKNPSGVIKLPLKAAELAGKGIVNTIADPTGTAKAAFDGTKDAITDYVPDNLRKIGGHVRDTVDSVGKAGKALASGKTILGPNTIANLTGTKLIPGVKKDRTVVGHAADAGLSASSAYNAAIDAANPSNLANNAAINTGFNIAGNRLKDSLYKTMSSPQDKKSTKPKI